MNRLNNAVSTHNGFLSCMALMALAMLLATGCSSSKRALKQGDYAKATLEAAKHLRKHPGNKTSQEVLRQAYPLARETALRHIRQANESGASDNYVVAADAYMLLNELAEAIHESPKALEVAGRPTRYDRELREVRTKAAEQAYTLANRLMKSGTLRDARRAYDLFVKTNRFVEGYRDVAQRIDEALDAATVKVVVKRPAADRPYIEPADYFYDRLLSEITRRNQRFVRFYTADDARRAGLTRPDQVLELDFSSFRTSPMRERSDVEEVSRDSVRIGSALIDGQYRDVYGTVRAQLIVYRREVRCTGSLRIRIIDNINGRGEESRDFPGRFVWGNEWATYKGDERALSDEQRELVRNEPDTPPTPQDLFAAFSRPLLDPASSYLRQYYRKLTEE